MSTTDPNPLVLFETHYAAILAHARRTFGAEADAEDLVQEAYLRLVKRMASGGAIDPERFLPYLRRMIANARISRYRRRTHEVLVEGGDAGSIPAIVRIDEHASDCEQDSLAAIEWLIANEAPEEASLVLLACVRGAPATEVAAALGVERPYPTIKRILGRARIGLAGPVHQPGAARKARACRGLTAVELERLRAAPRDRLLHVAFEISFGYELGAEAANSNRRTSRKDRLSA